jgi:hypothetical protein
MRRIIIGSGVITAADELTIELVQPRDAPSVVLL